MVEIARTAARAFGLEGAEVQPLGSSDNAAFRVRCGDADFLLRRHRPGGRGLEQIASELELLAWLGARGARVQRPLASQPLEVGGNRWSLLSWLPGEVHPAFSPEQAFAAGASLARLHHHLAAFEPGAGFRRPRRDLEFYRGLGADLQKFAWMPGEDRGRIQTLVARAEAAFAELGGRGWQLIHGDPQPLNWVWQGGVPAPIDFDLCGHGHAHADLCSAAYFLGHGEAVVRGYGSARALPADFAAQRRTFTGLAFLENLAFLARDPAERGFIEAEMLPYLRRELGTIGP